jgi:hypothetical protein
LSFVINSASSEIRFGFTKNQSLQSVGLCLFKQTKIRDKTDSYVLNQISQADIRPPAKRGAAKRTDRKQVIRRIRIRMKSAEIQLPLKPVFRAVQVIWIR